MNGIDISLITGVYDDFEIEEDFEQPSKIRAKRRKDGYFKEKARSYRFDGHKRTYSNKDPYRQRDPKIGERRRVEAAEARKEVINDD